MIVSRSQSLSTLYVTAPSSMLYSTVTTVRPSPQVYPGRVAGADRGEQHQIALFSLPHAIASRVASGIVAAVVFPYSPIFMITRSCSPSRSATAQMIRLFAWCGISRRCLPASGYFGEHVAAAFVHLAHSVLEHLLPFLLDVVQPLDPRSRATAACGCRRRASSETAPPEPSISFRKSMNPSSSPFADSTSIAPAPSPNSTQVARSV